MKQRLYWGKSGTNQSSYEAVTVVWVEDDSGLHWGIGSKDEEKWMEFKTYLKVEPERLVGRLDEVDTQNRVIKDDSIFGLNNWTDGGTTDRDTKQQGI